MNRSLLFLLASSALAAPISIQVSPGRSFVKLVYAPPDASPCTIALTDNSGLVPSVNDVNASLFTGANTDLTRTSANGFIWPTTQIGNTRTVFLGGPVRGDSRGNPGNASTIGLQCNTRHTLTLTCAGGSSVTTVDFSTKNIPLGNYYPDLPLTDATAPFGQMVLPTFQWDRTTPYVGENGIVLRQVTLPMDFSTSLGTQSAFVYARDLSSAWTNPDNAWQFVQDSAHLATTSTVGAKLFLAWNGPINAVTPQDATSGNSWLTDIQAAMYGNGTGTVDISISKDSGQTSASGIVNVTLGSNVVVSQPSGYPTNYFKAWGVNPQTLGGYDLVNQSFTNSISTSGSVVTFGAGTLVNLRRKAGSKFKLYGCAGGTGNGTYTYASVDSFTQITAQEVIGTGSGCIFQDLAAGIIVSLHSAGTINVSATFNTMLAVSPQSHTNPNHDACNFNKVTDIATECDGNVPSSPVSGYLCQIGDWNTNRAGIYLIQDNGKMCLQSVMYTSPTPFSGYATAMLSAWDATNPKKIAMQAGGNLITAIKNSTNYAAYNPGIGNPVVDDWTYTQITPSPVLADANPSNPSQLKSLCAPPGTPGLPGGGTNFANCAAIFNNFTTGLWTPFSLAATFGGYAVYNSSPTTATAETFFLKLRVDNTGTLVQAFSTFDKSPYRWVRQHSSPQGVGPWVLVASAGGVVFDSGLTGAHVLQITNLHQPGPNTFVATTLPVSSCTAANPIVCTTSVQHRLDQYAVAVNGFGRGRGSIVTISGGSGGWSAINGTFMAVPVGNILNTIGSATTFSLYGTTTGTAINGSGFGSYPGGITFTTSPPIKSFSVFAMDASNPAVLTLNQLVEGIEPYTPDHTWQDGDAVGIDSYPSQQFYVKRLTATTLSLYTTGSLTAGSEVNTTNFPNLQGHGIYTAEACPAGMPNLAFDSNNFTGKVRCVQFTIAGEPCSYMASAPEQAKYPCALDASNTGKAQLQTLIVGDAIGDAGRGQFLENMRVGARSGNIVTAIRMTGDLLSPNQAINVPAQNNHEVGWLPYMMPSSIIQNNPSGAMVNATDPTATASIVAPSTGGHTDLGYCNSTLYTYTGANGVPGTSQDNPIPCTTIAAFQGQVPVQSHQWQSFQGYNTVIVHDGYVSARVPFNTGTWVNDWPALDSLTGGINGSGSFLYARSFTLASGTSHVYKIGAPPSETFSPKIAPMYCGAGPLVLIDKSGPASLITDSDIGKCCTAYAVNECRSGSSIGDRFMALAWDIGITTAFGCSGNTMNIPTACMYQLGALDSFLVQEQVIPFDQPGKRLRGLTRGLMSHNQAYSFQSSVPTPDGKWSFFVTEAMNGASQNFLAARIPPFAVPDSIDRTRYVSMPIQVGPGRTGDTVRIAHGYAENGLPTDFYCTSRADACFSSSTTTDTNPFNFQSETQSPTACAAGCTISLNLISGRVAFYQFRRRDVGGNETAGPLQSIVVP